MNTMSHKGYTARVEYDERDNIFIGRILGVRNFISFHGETVAELRAEFVAAVNCTIYAQRHGAQRSERLSKYSANSNSATSLVLHFKLETAQGSHCQMSSK